MAPEKTEVLLVTDRRSFQYPRIVLGHHEVEWETSIKNLGVQLDRRLSFGEHLKIAAAKSIQCEANLAKEVLGQAVGAELTPETMVALMLQSERFWTLIESFVTLMMKTRELDGRRERNNGEASIGACTHGPASRADSTVCVVRGKIFFSLPLAGAACRFA